MKEPTGRLLHEKRVAELISNLLQHYWTADDPPAARQAQIEDWIEDLADWPLDIIEAACREWRQHNTRRPMPAEMIEKCREINQMRLIESRRTLPAPVIDYEAETADGRLEQCARNYPRCADRWEQKGFICKALCRKKIPGYYDKSQRIYGDAGL